MLAVDWVKCTGFTPRRLYLGRKIPVIRWVGGLVGTMGGMGDL